MKWWQGGCEAVAPSLIASKNGSMPIGTGRGKVDPEAFPEPFLGGLTSPAGVVLGLNPGEVFPELGCR